MDKELIQLVEKLSSLSDDDLIRMINNDHDSYRSEALTIAKLVMKRRGFSFSRKGYVIDNRKTQSPASEGEPSESTKEHAKELNKLLTTINCPRCQTKLDYVGTRRLNEERSIAALGELGEMYKSGAHEFLDVYTCGRCGHVEFFVDGLGDELRPY